MKQRIAGAALTLLFSALYFYCLSGISDLLLRSVLTPHGILNIIAAFLLLMVLVASVCLGMYSSKKLMARRAKRR